MNHRGDSIVDAMNEWLDRGTRSDRQWNGHHAATITDVLRVRGWRRSPADEGYSRLSYTAWRHATETGRVHVTQASFLGAFTQVERLGG